MKFNMKKAAALLLAGSMVVGYAVPAAAEAEEKVVTAAMDQSWDTMMPLNTTSNYTRFICDQIYDRLTQTNADGSIEGRLAESWTVNDASDAVTLSFTRMQSGLTVSLLQQRTLYSATRCILILL